MLTSQLADYSSRLAMIQLALPNILSIKTQRILLVVLLGCWWWVFRWWMSSPRPQLPATRSVKKIDDLRCQDLNTKPIHKNLTIRMSICCPSIQVELKAATPLQSDESRSKRHQIATSCSMGWGNTTANWRSFIGSLSRLKALGIGLTFATTPCRAIEKIMRCWTSKSQPQRLCTLPHYWSMHCQTNSSQLHNATVE